MGTIYTQNKYKFVDIQSVTHHEGFPIIIYNTMVDADHLIHKHDFIEIVMVKSGTGKHILENTTHHLVTGDVFVIPRGVKHGFCDVDNLNLINFIFQMNSLDRHFPELKRIPSFFSFFIADCASHKMKRYMGRLLNLTQDEFAVVKKLQDKIEAEQKEIKPGATTVCLLYLAYLLIYLCRLIEQKKDNPFETTVYNNLPQVYQYISKHFCKKINLEELAKIAYMSKRNLQRIFRQTNDLSISQYIMNMRLEKARDLLRCSSMSVSSVALETGFQNSSYFAKQFKRNFSVSPVKYKRIVKHRSS